MVDLGTALSEQLLDVAVGEAEAEVPADRQHDDVRWEPEASEGRPRGCTRTSATGSHADSLAAQRSHSERNSAEYDPHPPFGGIDWSQVNRDIYEPMLGPMVQQQLADQPELLTKLRG
jgi:hypothetical protein